MRANDLSPADRQGGTAVPGARRAAAPLYTPDQRERRDSSAWTLVQGVLAPIQFLIFLVSLTLVLRYLATGDGVVAATISIMVKTGALYEGRRRDDTPFDLALKFDAQGRWHDVVQPAPAALPRTGWLIKRATRADAGHRPRVVKTWIDAPFYARSALATRLFGEEVRAVHESLALGRFRSPVVQSMLPYRMPRAFW